MQGNASLYVSKVTNSLKELAIAQNGCFKAVFWWTTNAADYEVEHESCGTDAGGCQASFSG